MAINLTSAQNPAPAQTDAYQKETPKKFGIKSVGVSNQGQTANLLFFLVLTIAVYYLIGHLGYIWGSEYSLPFSENFSPSLEGVSYLLIGLHIAVSIKYIKGDELGGVFFYGSPKYSVRRGLIYLPWGLLQLYTLPAKTFQDEVPRDDPSLLASTGEQIVISLTKKEKGSEHPYDMPMNAGFTANNRWRIVDPLIYLQVIGFPKKGDPNPEKTARIQMDAALVTAMKADFPKSTFLEISNDVDAKNRHLQRSMERLVSGRSMIGNDDDIVRRPWGVAIEETKLKDIMPNVEAPESEIRKLHASIAQAFETRTLADAEMYKKEKEGSGDATAAELLEKKTLTGRTAGLKDMSKKLALDPEVVLAAETAKNVTDGSENIFVGEGSIANVFGYLRGALTGIKKNNN